MDTLRRFGWMFARLVALAVLLLNAWIFIINMGEQGYDETWVLVWVLASGLVGAAGGLTYLFSIDGPPRFQTRPWRLGGWVGMMAASLLPHSFTFIVVPLVLALIPTLFMSPRSGGEPVTSS